MPSGDAWLRSTIRSSIQPAWLSIDAPAADIVLSSRCRALRNLRGHNFPHACQDAELETILNKVLGGNKESRLGLDVYRSLTPAERDYFVVSRLCSYEFEYQKIGRALLLDPKGVLSIMVNEEDHLRVQALTAGWSIENADRLCKEALVKLGTTLEFARTERFGYLAASPYNTGAARRLSSLFHLIGLANAGKLPTVMQALLAQGVVVRGTYGESSRAVGAFVQVSITGGTKADFIGACEYLIKEERLARVDTGGKLLERKAEEAVSFADSARSITLSDALRVLGWLRWASQVGTLGYSDSHRYIDTALSQLDIMTGRNEEKAAVERAVWLRAVIESLRRRTS